MNRPAWMGPWAVDEAVKHWTAKYRLVYQGGTYRIEPMAAEAPPVELDPVFSEPSLPEWSRSMVTVDDSTGVLRIESAPRDPCFRCYTGDFEIQHTCGR
jgi:hypothetical protein